MGNKVNTDPWNAELYTLHNRKKVLSIKTVWEPKYETTKDIRRDPKTIKTELYH